MTVKSRLGAIACGLVLIAATTPAHAYTVYVSNEKDDTITVIDSKTLKVTKTIKVGQRPRGIILSGDE